MVKWVEISAAAMKTGMRVFLPAFPSENVCLAGQEYPERGVRGKNSPDYQHEIVRSAVQECSRRKIQGRNPPGLSA